MREKSVCRHCFEHTVSRVAASKGRKPFAVTGSRPHYAPDLPFKLEHVRLDLSIDPVGRQLAGTVTQRVRAVSPGQSRIKLDQIGLTIEEARVDGKSAAFTVEGNALWIDLEGRGRPEPGEILEFAVKYRATNPRRGIYFTGPDEFYPGKPHQVWTQGQDEDSRYWFPSFDYPNQKATSEVIATVPQGYTAVSNGALLKREDVGGNTRFHYKLGVPHVMYLVTLAVARFEEWADQGPRGLPVQYFVAPGRVDDGKRAFGNTPKMIETFEKVTGVPYAYEKYSQVAVQDFIFGGMENTSATTQTDLTLHDARAHLDFTSDPLVSHELAHQWFGDLVTCRDWSHGWLNEGFATFMERVWVENRQGQGSEGGGLEEGKYYSYQDLQEHFAEDGGSYRRPIVCNTYIEPIDLFDTHLYQKGGLVLNLLRAQLGPELFWKSVNLYLNRHKGSSVETLDLIRAIEDATGRNMRRFFDEWIFGAGYPEFELSYSWHEEKKRAELVIEQKQTGGAPTKTENGATTHLFHLPVKIEFTLEGGKKVTEVVELGEARDRLFLALPSKPLMVRFDPDHTIPKTLKFPRPKELLLYQLASDADCMGRIEAAQELGKIVDPDVIAALKKALLNDPFWGVQAEAASVLEKVRLDSARDALIEGLGVGNPKARRALVKALGSYKDAKASHALRALAERDESYYVEADAVYAWAVSQFAPGASNPKSEGDVVEFLSRKLVKDSYRDVIRGAALRALAQVPGLGRGEHSRALDLLLEWTRRGMQPEARVAAVAALGPVVRTGVPAVRARILEILGALCDEDNFRLRMALVHALETSEAPEASGMLARIRTLDTDGRVKRHAQMAMDSVAMAGTAPESVATLKEQLEKLQEEHRKLRSLVEERGAGLK